MTEQTHHCTRTLLCFACFIFFFVIPSAADESNVLHKAPAITARDLSNRLVFSDSLTARGPLIIDFWATWCSPCIAEFKIIKKLVKKYADRNLTVLAVNEDGPSEITKVRQMVAMKKWPFVIVMDKGKAIAQKYHVTSLPALFLVGTDGKIHFTAKGFTTGDETELEKKILSLLPEKATD